MQTQIPVSDQEGSVPTMKFLAGIGYELTYLLFSRPVLNLEKEIKGVGEMSIQFSFHLQIIIWSP